MQTFTQKVLKVVSQIPKGSTLSYKEVAQRAGNGNAARAVGIIMKNNKDTSVPCHRVIRADGKLGGYNGLCGVSKEALLKRERSI
jgi:methylated-DNA-[protein]-cysteine S-methyltransferase